MKKYCQPNWLGWFSALIVMIAITCIILTRNGDRVVGSRVEGENHRRSSSNRNSQSEHRATTYLDDAQKALNEVSRRKLLEEFLDTAKYETPPLDGLRTLFRNWFQADAEQALEAAKAIDNQIWRAACLVEGVEILAKDPRTLVLVQEKLLTDEDSKFSFAVGCFDRLASCDAKTAFILLNEPAFLKYRRDAIEVFFRAYAGQNYTTFQNISNLVSNLPDSRDRNLALRCAIQAAPSKVRLEDYLGMKMITQDTALLSEAFGAYSTVAIKSQGVEGYLKSIQGIDVPENGRRTVLATCLQNLTRNDEVGKSLTKIEGSSLWRTGKDEAVVTSTVLSDFPVEDAMHFAASIGETNPQKGAAVECVATYLVRQDANRAAEWIATLPLGTSRNQALRPLLRYLETHHESESLAKWRSLLSTDAK